MRWAWKLHLELKLPDCIFPCVVGLAAVPQGCGFWRQSQFASSRAVVFMACCGFGTQFLFQLSLDAWFGYEGSLWHGGLLLKSEGRVGSVTGDFSRIPFQ